MSITDIRYTPYEDRSTEDTDKGGAVEIYEVDFDDQDNPRNRKFMARLGFGWSGPTKIPLMGESHPFDTFIYVINVDAIPMNLAAMLWKVTVIYESIGNPLNIPAVITYGGVSTNEPIDKTFPDTRLNVPVLPIANSSDELYDPQLTTEVADGVVTIVRNEESYDAFLMDSFRSSVNDNTWQAFALETVKLVSVNASEKRQINEFPYYEVTYVLHTRLDGWRKSLVDQGFRTIQLDGSGNPVLVDGATQYDEIVDSKGKKVTQPVYLNGQGQKLPEGEEIVKNVFLVNKRKDFDELGLPTI